MEEGRQAQKEGMMMTKGQLCPVFQFFPLLKSLLQQLLLRLREQAREALRTLTHYIFTFPSRLNIGLD